MQVGKLKFENFKNCLTSVAERVRDKILSMSDVDQNLCFVAEINKEYMGGQELCDKFEIDTKVGVNCLIVKGKSHGNYFFAALLVPVGHRYDINGVLKNRLACRMSVAPLDEVLELTKMEYGSITPVGLPNNWLVFADPKIFEQEHIICGAGKQTAKLCIPTKILKEHCDVEVLPGLAI